jgi:CubicO group peptidase (beta-lactamase class C family)
MPDIKKILGKRRSDFVTFFKFWWLIFLLLSLLSTCAPKSTIDLHSTTGKDPITEFKLRLDKLREELGIPGISLVVLHRQQVLFADGFGYANLENKIPATPETPYNIASLTKTFSAVVIMKLVEEGRLDLDAELAVLLENKVIKRGQRTFHGYSEACQEIIAASKNPFFRYPSLIRNYHCDSERITVRHLLTHTSQGVPGENYQYNGFLFGFLSSVVEAVSGENFDQILVNTIIMPFDMTSTIPSWDDKLRDRTLSERAIYYRKSLFGFVPSEYRTRLSASAGMVSNVMDLAKFELAMDRDLVVSKESKEAMFTATRSKSGKRLPYGLGWFVQNYKEMKLVWHYGHAPKAYSSLILKCLDRDATLILLANSDGASASFDLGAGDVMKSPFASAFIAFTEKIESAP